MLPSLISTIPPPSNLTSTAPTPEEIFSSSLALIFPDDIRNQHGDPGTSIRYHSRHFGDLKLRLAEPKSEETRRLMGHYVWNAGVAMAEMVGCGDDRGGEEGREEGGEGQGEEEEGVGRWFGKRWVGGVKGESVLELGSGTGLVGIVSVLTGAQTVVVTDFPTPEILANIELNVAANVPQTQRSSISVAGHEWGVLNTAFALTSRHAFTRVVAADCLWMPSQHLALVQSMMHFLALGPQARVWVIAGFHTGRGRLVPFFDVAVRLGLEAVDVWEVDADGVERECWFETDGGREDVTGRKKWLVVAILRRRQQQHSIPLKSS